MTVSSPLAAIAAGPHGPRIAAFFDLDGTLIDGYSALPYFIDRLRRREMSFAEAAEVWRMARRGDLDERTFAAGLAKTMAPWAGRPEEELTALWTRLFRDKIAPLLFPEAWRLVKAHQKMGHTVVIASSATHYQAAPIAEELGIAHVLATRVAARDGRLTGDLEGAPLWGAGKAEAVRDFAETHQIALEQSYGYANGNEDIAFLKTVRYPTVVNPQPMLGQTAQRAGWPVLRFAARRNASAAMRTRSVAAYTALAATSLGGLAYAVATGKRRRAAEWVGATSSDAVLAIAGIHVEVQGEHHLRDHRPSVFMFNHQSVADGYVLLKLLRGGFTGVAKKEVASMPLLGQILSGLDFAFIDRSDAKSAIAAMQPVIDRLRRGLSFVIAPEGTRSLSPRLGRFKKGPFHIALQAGAPIVPIVLRNTCEVLPRGSLLFRPGTVQVCVLPPVDVTRWRIEDLDRHVAEVRASFEHTLDDWPKVRVD